MRTLTTTARNDLLNQLQAVGCPVHATTPVNQKQEYILLAEGTPFITMGETLNSATITFEILAYPNPSLDNIEQLRRLDDLTGRIMSALWWDTAITCEGYTNTSLADNTPRFIAKFSVSATYTIEKEE